MNKDVCRFCGGNLTMHREYYVCEECKTVSFRSENADSDEIRDKILSYIAASDKARMKKQKLLHSICQKSTNHEPLSEEEKNLEKFAIEYIDTTSAIKSFVEGDIRLSDKRIRELLYKLLLLSENINEYFGEFTYV